MLSNSGYNEPHTSGSRKAGDIRQSNPDRIPVLLLPLKQGSKLASLKLLVPKESSYSHFISKVRKHLDVKAETGLYFFVGAHDNSSNKSNNVKIITFVNSSMAEIDSIYASSTDDFLYFYYDLEATFG